MADPVKAALASIWSHPDSTALEHFVCSAYFVAPNLLLSAAHAFNGAPRWARLQVDAGQARPLALQEKHPELDVALLALRDPALPAEAGWLALDLDPRAPAALSLNGYFEGRHEHVPAIRVLNFDPDARHFLLDVKQPEGHSGSALCRDGHVWGMTVRHYSAANVHRGCALSASQFYAWLQPLLPEQSQRRAVAAPPPADDWAGRARHGLQSAFRGAAVARLEAHLPFTDQGLPQAIATALNQAEPGPACVRAILQLADQLGADLAGGRLALTRAERAEIAAGLKMAMGCAARLCLSPAKLQALGVDAEGRVSQTLRVPVWEDASFGLVVRPQPEKCWARPATGTCALEDPSLVVVDHELGEGADAQDELARLSLRHFFPQHDEQRTVSDRERRRIKARANTESERGRARFYVFQPVLEQAAHETLRDWTLAELGIDILARDGADAGLFLMDEYDLLDRIGTLLAQLNEPAWNPT